MLSDKASLMNVPETMVAPPLESGKCTTSVEYIDPIMLALHLPLAGLIRYCYPAHRSVDFPLFGIQNFLRLTGNVQCW